MLIIPTPVSTFRLTLACLYWAVQRTVHTSTQMNATIKSDSTLIEFCYMLQPLCPLCYQCKIGYQNPKFSSVDRSDLIVKFIKCSLRNLYAS